MAEKILSPSSIIAGLMRADRSTLSLSLSLLENATAAKQLGDKSRDIIKSAKGDKGDDHYGARISETNSRIAESKLSNDALRVALWININSAFKLDPCLPIGPRSIGIVTAAIAQPVKALVNERRRKTTKKKAAYNVTFDQAVKDTILTLIQSVIKAPGTPEKQKEELLDLIKSQLSNLDKKTLQKHGLKDLTNSSVRSLIASGGLISLMVATEAAGFSAYILAAQLSSIIPFVGGQTLVSILAVASDPLFVGIVAPALGFKVANTATEGLQKAFALTITSILAITGFDLKWDEKTQSSELFCNTPELLKELKGATRYLKINNQKAFQELTKRSLDDLKIPKRPAASAGAVRLLNQSINKYDPKVAISDFLFPRNQPSSELAALSTITVGDLLFDLSSIDKDVIEATDFARSAEINDEFSFAALADSILSLPISSQIGHEANILGYTAERIVAAKLINQGHLVSFPADANQAGYDLLVDGKEFQVKCSSGSDLQLLETHFSKYPDTPVMANSELADMILEKSPEWASKVFFVEGYTHEFTNNLVKTSLEAGTSLYDTGIIPFVATVSAARNSYLWWKKEQSLQDASFNVALDTAAKGALSVMGGFAGKGIGLLLFGPAGGIVFGGAGAVLSTTQSHRITDRFDKALDKEKDQQLDKAARDLLVECGKQLNAKILGIDTIIHSLSDDELSLEMAYRWRWERVYVESQLREVRAIQDFKCTGERRAKTAIKFTYECGIHPVWFQGQYNELFRLLNIPKERFKKSVRFTRDFVRSRKKDKGNNP